MSEPSKIDGVLVQWGERLFYPHNRIVKVAPPPRLSGASWTRFCQAAGSWGTTGNRGFFASLWNSSS